MLYMWKAIKESGVNTSDITAAYGDDVQTVMGDSVKADQFTTLMKDYFENGTLFGTGGRLASVARRSFRV
jgi:ABC-type sulfate transport system substrate-binding protein